jgi:hypothetical protein
VTGDGNGDSLTLPVDGFEVCDVWFSGQLYVIAYGARDTSGAAEAPRTQLALGGAFTFREANGREHRLNAEEPWEALVPILSLRHKTVASAVATRRGVLNVVFDDGSAIVVASDPRYENWEMTGPGALLVVCTPGNPGTLAVWM